MAVAFPFFELSLGSGGTYIPPQGTGDEHHHIAGVRHVEIMEQHTTGTQADAVQQDFPSTSGSQAQHFEIEKPKHE